MVKPLDRRTFLRAAGACVSLPLLDAMGPSYGAERDAAPRRLLSVCTNLGVLDQNFRPTQSGSDYALTPYLEVLKPFRKEFTVISGTSHDEVTGGHAAEVSFLTAAPGAGSASFRNTISLDQFAAERIGFHTRVPSLPLVVSKSGNPSLSFSSSGVMLPAERSPAMVFRSLFVAGSPGDTARQIEQLRVGRSILDTVGARSASLKATVGSADRDRLEQYFTSVREVERRLLAAEEWEKKPKPKVDAPVPSDGEYLLEKLNAMYDLVRLAFATDSTRLVTLMIRLDGFGAHVPGVSDESHNLSHHVGRADKLEQLKKLELAQFVALSGLLKGLRDSKESGGSLLDNTVTLYGSNLGNGNNHDTRNLPILLAGGGFRHGQHLSFDRQRNYPLSNLFVSILKHLGVESDKFGTSTGSMRGLELA